MKVAYTVQDAAKYHSTELKLVHRKLRLLPEGLSALQSLTSLDASDNDISEFTAEQLAPHLKELTLTGCQLQAVPQSLAKLTGLEQLHLSANRIQQANTIFACPHLMHAGLSFNNISSLDGSCSSSNSSSSPCSTGSKRRQASPNKQQRSQEPPASPSSSKKHNSGHPASPVTCKQQSSATCRTDSSSNSSSIPTNSTSPLVSLDLSHNDVTDLPAALQQLKQLNQLKSLCLKGNPISLLPYYRGAVLQHLPQLLYLDGQKLDGISKAAPGSRPGTTSNRRRPGSAQQSKASADAAGPAAPGAAAATTADQQQQLAAAFSNMFAPSIGMAGGEEIVTIPLWLEVSKLQLVEAADQVFAAIAAASARQQQLLLHKQAGAESSTSGTTAHLASDSAAAGIAVPGTESSNESSAGAAGALQQAAAVVGNGVQAATAAGAAAAAAAVVAAIGAPVVGDVVQLAVPLKPVQYHMEMAGPDGSEFCSTALVVAPPQPAAADTTAAAAAAATDTKKPDAKGGKLSKQDSKVPAVGKPRPGSSVRGVGAKGRAGVDDGSALNGPPAVSQLAQGRLCLMTQLPITVAGRDFLRHGFTVKLIRTHYEPDALIQQPPAAAPAAPAAAPTTAAAKRPPSGKPSGTGAGGKASKLAAATAAAAADTSAPPMAPQCWHYDMKQQLLGTATVAVPDMLESCGQQPAEGTAEFMPPAPLFSSTTGTLLSLKDASRKLQPVGSCRFKLMLHHQPAASACSTARLLE